MILAALCFALGAFGWTFAEYALHNWWGHLGRGRNEFSREHLKHHATPGYFTPTPKKARTAAATIALLLVATLPFVAASAGLPFFAGFLVTYVGYEVLHRRIHTHAPRGPYGRWARRHHLHHHFGDSRKNHGVTSPIWDLVFGTLERPPRIAVPRRFTPAWLVEGDAVRAAFARDYRLRAGGGRGPEDARP